MKFLVPCIGFFFLATLISCRKATSATSTPVTPTVDSFTVIVTNGYGTGTYKAGDTVHIWSKELTATQLFDTWASTDVSLLNTNDWHAWFIMQPHNVSFIGNVKTTTGFTLNYEQIRGRDRLKPVYSYFPANHKGIVYMLHGTSGTAANLVNSFEGRYILNELVGDGFAVIVTEAEEATTQIDADGDGKLSWLVSPIDTLTNIDLVNIRNITDTFYNRGTTNRSRLRYTLGMSNGGFFSGIVSYAFKFKAGISYCAPSGALVGVSSIPLQYCMQRDDNNPNVGPVGNAIALNNSQTLSSRGICSKYFINEHSPLYPQRFARRSDISIATSAAIFNELKNKGYLNSKNYYIGYSTSFIAAYQASPSSYPVFSALIGQQKIFVLDELDCCITDHQLYSDYTKLSLKFLNTQCQ